YTQPRSSSDYATGRSIGSPLCGTSGSCYHHDRASGGCNLNHGYQTPTYYDARYRLPDYRYDDSYNRPYRSNSDYGDSAYYGPQPWLSTGHRSRIPLPRSNEDYYLDTYGDTIVQPASRTRSRDPFYP
ncbi:MAG: hypothetical protein ACREJB_12980, partial [Planctomycetaceae bacterium]